MATDFAAVVMAAGLGTRMKSATPKHLHPLLGRRLVDWVVAAVRPLGPDPLVVVLAFVLGFLAIVAVVLFAIIALVYLFSDYRRT